jgi:hypothetical protein
VQSARTSGSHSDTCLSGKASLPTAYTDRYSISKDETFWRTGEPSKSSKGPAWIGSRNLYANLVRRIGLRKSSKHISGVIGWMEREAIFGNSNKGWNPARLKRVPSKYSGNGEHFQPSSRVESKYSVCGHGRGAVHGRTHSIANSKVRGFAIDYSVLALAL